MWPGNQTDNSVALALSDGNYKTVFSNLLENDGFKRAFLERFAYHLENTFTEEKLNGKIDEIHDLIEPEKQREGEFFSSYITNYHHYSEIDSTSDLNWISATWEKDFWEKEVEKLKEWVTTRKGYIIYFLGETLNVSDGDMTDIFGTTGTAP